jgi:hypothetical protein
VRNYEPIPVDLEKLGSDQVSLTRLEQSIANNRNPSCIALQLLKETANPTVLTSTAEVGLELIKIQMAHKPMLRAEV